MNLSRFREALRGGSTLEAAFDSQVYWKGGSNKQKSESTVTPHQQKDFDKLLKGSGSWLSQGGFDKNYGGSADFNSVAGMTQGQQDGIQGSQDVGQYLQGMYNQDGGQSLGNFFGAYDPEKTGLNSAMSAAAEQAQFDFETGQMGNIRQGATDTGQYGSSRAGIAEGLARGRLAQGIAANNSQMAFQDQQQFNQNQLGMLGNLSAITKGLSSGAGLQYEAGSLEQQQEQNEINGQLQKWVYENNASLNDLLAYKQLISGDMGGTSKGESKGGGGGSGGMGALASFGGSALGSYMGAG